MIFAVLLCDMASISALSSSVMKYNVVLLIYLYAGIRSHNC
jgi:hypothetical protein